MKTGAQPQDPRDGLGEDAAAARERASFLLKAYENVVPEFLKKTILLGLGGMSMTEDGIRKVLTDMRLPRDEARRIFEYLVEQSTRTKSEVLSLVGTEFKSFLRTLNLEEEMRRVLEDMRIKIQAEISFERKESASAPRLDLQVRTSSPTSADPGGPAAARPADGGSEGPARR